ncbi:hypothetical protein IJF86_00950 [Candidatus Saccharibacteria bacterium]|nr:hypothetical protein [Candidatus Saccharibacteria bacterium]MBQ2659981.1 hypothetical protein [Candidatus Saccharibacteria bacterium]
MASNQALFSGDFSVAIGHTVTNPNLNCLRSCAPERLTDGQKLRFSILVFASPSDGFFSAKKFFLRYA